MIVWPCVLCSIGDTCRHQISKQDNIYIGNLGIFPGNLNHKIIALTEDIKPILDNV